MVIWIARLPGSHRSTRKGQEHDRFVQEHSSTQDQRYDTVHKRWLGSPELLELVAANEGEGKWMSLASLVRAMDRAPEVAKYCLNRHCLQKFGAERLAAAWHTSSQSRTSLRRGKWLRSWTGQPGHRAESTVAAALLGECSSMDFAARMESAIDLGPQADREMADMFISKVKQAILKEVKAAYQKIEIVGEFSYGKDSSSFASPNLNRTRGQSGQGIEKRLPGAINERGTGGTVGFKLLIPYIFYLFINAR